MTSDRAKNTTNKNNTQKKGGNNNNNNNNTTTTNNKKGNYNSNSDNDNNGKGVDIHMDADEVMKVNKPLSYRELSRDMDCCFSIYLYPSFLVISINYEWCIRKPALILSFYLFIFLSSYLLPSFPHNPYNDIHTHIHTHIHTYIHTNIHPLFFSLSLPVCFLLVYFLQSLVGTMHRYFRHNAKSLDYLSHLRNGNGNASTSTGTGTGTKPRGYDAVCEHPVNSICLDI